MLNTLPAGIRPQVLRQTADGPLTLARQSWRMLFVQLDAPKAFLVELPAGPIEGDIVEVFDSSGTASTFAITIDGNGKTIDGGASSSISADFGSTSLRYDGAAWFSFSSSGAGGLNAFSTTTADFVQPAINATVSVSLDSTWMAVGQVVFVATAGYMQVSALPDTSHATLTNLGYSGNAAPAATISHPVQVTPGGLQGSSGTNGKNAFSSTSADFVQPAVNATVTVTVDSTWMNAGQVVYIAGGGFYSVSSLPDSASAVLTNLGYNGNAAPNAAVVHPAQISPAGLQGPAPAGTGIVYTSAGTPTAYSIGAGLSISGASIIGRGGGAVSRAAATLQVWFQGGNYTLSSGQVSVLTDLSGNSRDATKQAGVGSRTRSIRVVTPSGAPAWTLETPLVTPSFACPKMYTVHMAVRRKWNTVTNVYNAFFGTVNLGTDGAGLSIAGAVANDWQAGDLVCFGNGFNSGRAPRLVTSGFPQFADNEWVVISARIGTTPVAMVNGYTMTLRASTTTSQAGSNSSGAMWIGSNPSTSDQVDITSAMAEFVLYSGEQSDVDMNALHNDMIQGYLGAQ